MSDPNRDRMNADDEWPEDDEALAEADVESDEVDDEDDELVDEDETDLEDEESPSFASKLRGFAGVAGAGAAAAARSAGGVAASMGAKAWPAMKSAAAAAGPAATKLAPMAKSAGSAAGKVLAPAREMGLHKAAALGTAIAATTIGGVGAYKWMRPRPEATATASEETKKRTPDDSVVDGNDSPPTEESATPPVNPPTESQPAVEVAERPNTDPSAEPVPRVIEAQPAADPVGGGSFDVASSPAQPAVEPNSPAAAVVEPIASIEESRPGTADPDPAPVEPAATTAPSDEPRPAVAENSTTPAPDTSIPEPVPPPAEAVVVQSEPAPTPTPKTEETVVEPLIEPQSRPATEEPAPSVAEETSNLPPMGQPQVTEALTATPAPATAAIEESTASAPRRGLMGAIGSLFPSKEEHAEWVEIPNAGRSTAKVTRASSVGASTAGSLESRPRVISTTPRVRAETARHVVQPGENFWTIAKDYYGDGRYYKALWAANRGIAPRIEELYVGSVVSVPRPESLDPSLIDGMASRSKGWNPERSATRDDQVQRRALVEPDLAPSSRSSDGIEGESVPVRSRVRNRPRPAPRYVVGANETLRSIARSRLGDPTRAEEIYGLNRSRIEDPNRLEEGTELILPAEAASDR